jgi:hypothetical protein
MVERGPTHICPDGRRNLGGPLSPKRKPMMVKQNQHERSGEATGGSGGEDDVARMQDGSTVNAADSRRWDGTGPGLASAHAKKKDDWSPSTEQTQDLRRAPAL